MNPAPAFRLSHIAARGLFVVAAVGCSSNRAAPPAGEHTSADTAAVSVVRGAATPLTGSPTDYDALFARIGDARVVLLGEATHGTHEFYRERARITRRLIEEKGFTAVAIEGDWPRALRVDRYVRGGTEDASAKAALRGFDDFPVWMWRNTDVRDFVEWLRDHNRRAEPAAAAGTGASTASVGTHTRTVRRWSSTTRSRAKRR